MKTNTLKKILVLMLFSVFCLQATISAQEKNKTDNVKSDTTWKYLGRPLPEMLPLRFPPDSLLANNNWMWHGVPVFSPDYKEMFWCLFDNIIERGKLVFTKYINYQWTPMQFVPFGNQNYFEGNPFFSYSGDTLFFISRRPGGFIFKVCRTETGWTEPVPLDIPIPTGYRAGTQFSIAKSGTVYFELFLNGPTPKADLYESKFINGQYQTPENLGVAVNSESSDIFPCIDPEEKFIIFASMRPGGYGLHDIYISTRNPDNTWNNPINLGPTINSSSEDGFPLITPDSHYFFFTAAKQGDYGYNPYWISIQYIKNLISIGMNNQPENVNDFE